MRLIDADELVEDIRSCMYDFIGSLEEVDRDIKKHEYAIDRINDAPTVEPKKGHWERTDKYTGFAYMSYMKCSECGASMSDIYTDDFNFCPYCGTDMRGEDK